MSSLSSASSFCFFLFVLLFFFSSLTMEALDSFSLTVAISSLGGSVFLGGMLDGSECSSFRPENFGDGAAVSLAGLLGCFFLLCTSCSASSSSSSLLLSVSSTDLAETKIGLGATGLTGLGDVLRCSAGLGDAFCCLTGSGDLFCSSADVSGIFCSTK